MLSVLSITYTSTPHAPSWLASALGPRVWTERKIAKAVYKDKDNILVDSMRRVRGSLKEERT